MRTFLTILLLITSSCYATTVEFFNHNDFIQNTSELTLIDFDNLPHNSQATGTEFSDEGLIIEHRNGLNFFYGVNNRPETINSQQNGVASGLFTGGSDNFDFIFTEPAHSAGLFIGNVGPGITEVEFLAEDNSVIAREVLDQNHEGLLVFPGDGFDNRIFYGITSDVAIKRIRTIEPGGDSDNIVYDDVQFGTNSIPEPSSFVLGIISVLLLAFSCLRKNR